MPSDDARRWDDRYRDVRWASKPWSPHSYLAANIKYFPQTGRALDLATGLGHDAGFLADLGWQVVAVDISREALKRARCQHPAVWFIQADLTQFSFAPHLFDLITVFNYLQRNVLADFYRILRPGGLAIVETLTIEVLKIKPDIPIEYLLRRGELKVFFSEFDILEYEEGWFPANQGTKPVARLVAMKA